MRHRILSIAVAACLLLAACSADPPTDTGPATSEPTTTDGAVTMANVAFAPASLTVTVGSKVTWTNDDTVPHTVSFSGGGPGSSEIIEPGQTFEATFEEPGTFEYTCTLHPGMAGTVEVIGDEAAASSPPNAAAPEGSDPPDDGNHGGTMVDVRLPGAGSAGVDIALGEWALVPSVREAPPGTITFRFRNQGTVAHGLRIRTAGSGKNRSEWRAEAIGPGETALLTVDLGAGAYEIDCPVEDAHGEHDQLGMEMAFSVHEGAAALAPLAGAAPGGEASGNGVTIAGFAFSPTQISVAVGSTVTWHNADPTPHTATGEGFDTGVIEQGAGGAVTFDQPGAYEYFCSIHPEMRGLVTVGS